MIPLIGPERPEILCEDEELETLFLRSKFKLILILNYISEDWELFRDDLKYLSLRVLLFM